MENSELGDLLNDPKNLKRFNQNTLLLELASLIYKTMREKEIKPAALAVELGVTKGRVSQYLSGQMNLRLRTLADIFTALECKVIVDVEPMAEAGQGDVLAGEQVQKLHKHVPKWDYFLKKYVEESANLQLAG